MIGVRSAIGAKSSMLERDAELVRDGQQVEHRVGRAAGGSDRGDRVVDRRAGHDRRRPDVVATSVMTSSPA
jgi:hypothetical protein